MPIKCNDPSELTRSDHRIMAFRNGVDITQETSRRLGVLSGDITIVMVGGRPHCTILVLAVKLPDMHTVSEMETPSRHGNADMISSSSPGLLGRWASAVVSMIQNDHLTLIAQGGVDTSDNITDDIHCVTVDNMTPSVGDNTDNLDALYDELYALKAEVLRLKDEKYVIFCLNVTFRDVLLADNQDLHLKLLKYESAATETPKQQSSWMWPFT